MLLRFAFLWIGVYLGLLTHANPEAVTAVRTIEFPIGFLGHPFVAIATMPAWLGAIATVPRSLPVSGSSPWAPRTPTPLCRCPVRI
ncbi:hypothetical protein AB0L63_23410 [Nocardia sp. NPDC051990]|uniref:hypothetical protein n=1 Tax=Nocardia sp. NPDC051990 TaxID=3155285 RepID=UPI00341FA753